MAKKWKRVLRSDARTRALWLLAGAAVIAVWGLSERIAFADRNEVILTFVLEGRDGEPVDGGVRVTSAATGAETLRSGQRTTVAEGELIAFEALPAADFGFVRWEGALSSHAMTTSSAFLNDSTIRLVLAAAPAKEPAVAPGEAPPRSPEESSAAPATESARTPVVAKSHSAIWVDFGYFGIELGTQANPYNTLSEGAQAGGLTGTIGEPATINVQPGFSNEIVRIDPAGPVRIVAPNGGFRVGTSSLYFMLAVNASGLGTIMGAGAYAPSAIVPLNAAASSGWAFSHWEGDMTGYINPTTVLMDGNKTVTAVFLQNPSNLDVTAFTRAGGALIPTEGTAGDVLNLEWKVTNSSGNAAVSGGDGDWTDNVYLSRDASFSADDKALHATGFTTTEPIPPGVQYTVNLAITLPDVSPGEYYLIARPDADAEAAQTAANRDAGDLEHQILIIDPELKL